MDTASCFLLSFVNVIGKGSGFPVEYKPALYPIIESAAQF